MPWRAERLQEQETIMPTEEERLQILEMIASGKISAEQGIELLSTLTGEVGDSFSEAEGASLTGSPNFPTREDVQFLQSEELDEMPFQSETKVGFYSSEQHGAAGVPPGMNKWQNFWWVPMAVGVGTTVLASLIMFFVFLGTGLSFWFACSWLPFLIGVGLVVFAWVSRTMRWLHLRIQQKPGEHPQNINISFPLPLGLAAWFVRTFKHWLPANIANIDTALLALKDTSGSTPFYMEVDEGEGRERVEIYIG
jgi:hypothetical protein